MERSGIALVSSSRSSVHCMHAYAACALAWVDVSVCVCVCVCVCVWVWICVGVITARLAAVADDDDGCTEYSLEAQKAARRRHRICPLGEHHY